MHTRQSTTEQTRQQAAAQTEMREDEHGQSLAPPGFQVTSSSPGLPPNTPSKGDANSPGAQPFQLKTAPIQREDEAEDPRLDELEGLGNLLFNVFHNQISQYQSEFERVRPLLNQRLGQIGDRFETAWGNHNRILRQASADAQTENLVRGILIGAAASVAVAAGAAAIPALAALAPFSGGWWALQGGGALVSSAGGAAAAEAISAPTNFNAVPQNMAQISQLAQLLTFERRASTAHLVASNIGRKSSSLDLILQEMRAGRGAGVSREADQFLARQEELHRLPDAYSRARQAMERMRERLENFRAPSTSRIEKAIWVHWIGSLSNADHDLLDRDAVEDHLIRIGVLGSNGILGVDTTDVWDTAEEQQAIRTARRMRGNLQSILSTPT